MSVRIGLVGNSFARIIQLPALRWAGANGAPNEVVAVAGSQQAKADETASEWGIPYATDDWTTLFGEGAKAGPIDLAIISTPVDLHAPMVRAALAAGTAILCEKPFAMDGDEARALRDEARGHFALIDHQTRWSPWRRAFKDALAGGICGDPWAARIQMRLGSAPRIQSPFTWWYDAARGGGVLGALGSHVLDGVMDQFGVRIESVNAELLTFIKNRSGLEGTSVPVTADEEAILHCVTETGVPLMIETSVVGFGCERDTGQGSLQEVRGSKGTLRLEGETELLFIPHGGSPEPIAVEALPTVEELGMKMDNVFPRCLPGYLRDVIGAVASGRDTLEGAATFDDAVHVMDIMDAARTSSAEGRRVAVRTGT